MRAQLPGKAKTGGLWPAFWMMGNLARATYTATSDWMWPWSYEKGCDRAQQKHQKISPCTRTAHYGFHPFQGTRYRDCAALPRAAPCPIHGCAVAVARTLERKP